ncbi:MAG: SRPBCC family protein [Micromonosporaceae bacterium]
MKSRFFRIAAGGAALTACAAAAYPVLWRRRCLTWGATADEVRRGMPGDELLPVPDLLATRAVTIKAAPIAIWPWLVQMGSGRGGAYSYDWIENLFGLNMHSANEIIPELQDLKEGDLLPLGSKGPRMRVERLEPDRTAVFRSEDGNWVWAFGIYPDGEMSRLVSRNRIAIPGASTLTRVFNVLVMEPGSLVMERRMLLGIKERAERGARQHNLS